MFQAEYGFMKHQSDKWNEKVVKEGGEGHRKENIEEWDLVGFLGLRPERAC